MMQKKQEECQAKWDRKRPEREETERERSEERKAAIEDNDRGPVEGNYRGPRVQTNKKLRYARRQAAIRALENERRLKNLRNLKNRQLEVEEGEPVNQELLDHTTAGLSLGVEYKKEIKEEVEVPMEGKLDQWPA